MDFPTRIDSAAYIFEGQVIQSQPYWTSRNGTIYTDNLVQIHKIFKGNIVCGTLEMIILGGHIGDQKVSYDHTLELLPGQMGLFLCTDFML